VADLGLLLVGTFRDEALEPGRPLAAALGQTIARKLAASTPARAAWPTPTCQPRRAGGRGERTTSAVMTSLGCRSTAWRLGGLM